MKLNNIYKFNEKYFFRTGVFLLASAPFISIILFFITICISIYKNKGDILLDKHNRIFLISAIGIIIISIIHIFTIANLSIEKVSWDNINNVEKIFKSETSPFSSLIGLSNWIPLFLCFFYFQNYLDSMKERKIIMKLFVAGTFPVLISGFGQYWFNWHGPLTLLNGLIIWFQKPNLHLSGLFSNQNYAGCWLNIVWPFSIAIFLEKKHIFLKKGASIIFMISILLASFLTSSRNAWGGLFLTLPILLSTYSSRLLLFIIAICLLSLILFLLNLFSEGFNILSQINIEEYSNSVDRRSSIILFAAKMIFKNPILGYGAATFPIYYFLETAAYKGHTHNLIIDLTFNYGIIISILIFSNIFKICFESFNKIFLSKLEIYSNNYFERAWWTSFFILLLSQMVDVQYYDLRISISFWILLSGLKCIIKEKINLSNNMTYTN